MALTAEYVRGRISYDPETGVLRWRARPIKSRIDKMWNTRFAGAVISHHNSSGHIQFGFDGRNRLAHRIAWLIVYGREPRGDIDHVNGIRDDNRLANLREATRSQNAVNSKMRSSNTSGYRGVCWNKRQRKWSAAIAFNRRKRHLGYFDDARTAAEAYDAAAITTHKQFATLNFGRVS